MSGSGKLILYCFIVVVATPITAHKTEHLSRTATSSIKTQINEYGQTVVVTTNSRFTYTDIFPHPVLGSSYTYPIVLLEEFRSEWVPGMEGKKSTVQIEARALDSGNLRKKIWSIQSEGDEGQVFDSYYLVTRYGCCANLLTQVWFNLLTGQKVFTSSEPLTEIIVPNTSIELTRYVAYHSNEAILQPEEAKTVKDMIGVIQYGSEREALRRMIVRARFNPGRPNIGIFYKGKLHRQTHNNGRVMLWGADGKDDKSSLSDFSIVLSWRKGFEISIPVKDDEIEIGRARISGKLILEATK